MLICGADDAGVAGDANNASDADGADDAGDANNANNTNNASHASNAGHANNANNATKWGTTRPNKTYHIAIALRATLASLVSVACHLNASKGLHAAPTGATLGCCAT